MATRDTARDTISDLEIVSGLLMSLRSFPGWKPRRTIVLCSWGAEEPGLIGSTEWAEVTIDHFIDVSCNLAASPYEHHRCEYEKVQLHWIPSN